MKTASTVIGLAAMIPLLLPTTALLAKTNDVRLGLNVPGLSTEAQLKNKVGEKMEKRLEKKRETVVRGSVSTINGMHLTVVSKDGVSHAVDTTNAKLVMKGGGKMTFDEIKTNDKVMVNGYTTGTSTTIIAKLIRNESLESRNGSFSGTVTSTTGTGFIIETKNGPVTVTTNSSTTIKKNDRLTASLSDIAVGTMVRVTGTFNSTAKTIAARLVNIIARTHPITVSGTVTTKTDTVLTVKNEKGIIYTVATGKVSFFGKEWNTLTLADVAVGDKVSIYGTQLNDSTSITGIWLRSSVK